MLKKLILILAMMGCAMAQPKAHHKAAPASAATANDVIALRGGKLLTVSHGVIENGVLVMEKGRITAVGGANTAIPKGAKVIEVSGMTVYPGLIDSETRL